MGELLDALNGTDAGSIARDAPTDKSTAEKVGETMRSASKGVDEAIEKGRQPSTPLDTLARMVRQAPLHSLAIAFLLGAAFFRRR
jgi:hypothetical protein